MKYYFCHVFYFELKHQKIHLNHINVIIKEEIVIKDFHKI